MSISEEKKIQLEETRRKQILDAAIELFDVQGFSNTKIIDISKKAGISKGLVYHYFNSKEDILFALKEYATTCINECASQERAIDGIELFAKRLLSYPYFEEIPPLRVFFNALIRKEVTIPDEENPIYENFGREYFGPLFKKAQEQGDIKEGDPTLFGDIYWKYLLGILSCLAQRDITQGYQPDMSIILNLFRD